MRSQFSKNIIISLAIHIICIASFIILGFQHTDIQHKASTIKPHEMVFTLETASAIMPSPSGNEIVKSKPKTQKTLQKKTAQNPVKKNVKQTRPKVKKKIVKKTAHKRIKIALKQKTEKKQSKNKTSIEGRTQAGLKMNSSASATNTLPTNTKIQFNPKHIIAQIKNKIAHNKYYPNSAKRRGIEGRVGLQLAVSQNGTIQSLHIINSSGSKILDKAAIKSVRSAVPFIKMAQSITFKFFMKFNLEDA